MTRPKKATVDYFPHSCTDGKTMYVIESKYGNDGYAFWFKLLELLGSTAGQFFDCNKPENQEFLSAKTRIEWDKCCQILDTLSILEAIDSGLWKKKIIWSDNFVEGIKDAYRRRKDLLPQKPTAKEVIDSKNPVNDDINPQSKVKESKEKVKKNKNTLYSFALTGDRDFKIDEEFFKEKQKLYPGVDLMLQFGRMTEWLNNNPLKRKSSEQGIKNFITNWLKKEQDQRSSGGVPVKMKPEYPKIVTCNFCEEKYRLMRREGSCDKCGECFYGYRPSDGTWKERYPGSDDEEIKAFTAKAADSMGGKK